MSWVSKLSDCIAEPHLRSGKTWEQIRQEWIALMAEVQVENAKAFEGMTIKQVYELLKEEEADAHPAG